MDPIPPPPHDDELGKLDWPALLKSARRLLRYKLSGFQPQDIDDAVQVVSERMVVFARRNGLPRSPEGLLVHIVRAVASDTIKQRSQERSRIESEVAPDFPAPGNEDDGEAEEALVHDFFLVRQYLALRRSLCLPGFDARARGESPKEYAARTGVSYDQVRQSWSRCVRFVREAVDKGRLRLGSVPPRRREASDD